MICILDDRPGGYMPILIEYKVLTNEERRYFGLEPLLPGWERLEIKPGFSVYFDGDVIRKTISFRTLSGMGYENFLEYNESDNEIQTRERRMVLPRTKKGKEKKLNYTSVSAMKPTGCTFRMNLTCPNLPSSLFAGNTRNSINLPIVFPDNIGTLEEFREWISDFITDCPIDYFSKVERMKSTPHRTVKYFNGDIFRFEVDLEHYGFALVIGQIRKMQKDGLIRKEHILGGTLGVPLLVRLYGLKSIKKDMDVEEITSYPLGKTFIMMDNQVIWGAYDIIGSKILEASDIDFPIQVQAGKKIDGQNQDNVLICWGPGIIIKRNSEKFPKQLLSNRLMRHGCHFGINRNHLERTLESCQTKPELDDLEQIAFQYFDIPLDTTFDEFNLQHDGMTFVEYATYANKDGRIVRAK